MRAGSTILFAAVPSWAPADAETSIITTISRSTSFEYDFIKVPIEPVITIWNRSVPMATVVGTPTI